MKGDYPEADSYGEFTEKYFLPGGETGTCATVLASLGTSVKMDGNHLGQTTYTPIREFYGARGVDISSMTYDPAYPGLQDYVLIGGNTRTCIGEFQQFYADPPNGRWNQPKREHSCLRLLLSILLFRRFRERHTNLPCAGKKIYHH